MDLGFSMFVPFLNNASVLQDMLWREPGNIWVGWCFIPGVAVLRQDFMGLEDHRPLGARIAPDEKLLC